jgi:hypothetical protein
VFSDASDLGHYAQDQIFREGKLDKEGFGAPD